MPLAFGQPNLANYSFNADIVAYSPIAGTDIPILKNDFAFSTAIPIGFDFYYMGNRYEAIYINSNGYASFDPEALLADSNTQTFNDLTNGGNTFQNFVLAPLWDDLIADSATGSVEYLTSGTAPNRVFTVEWSNMLWPNIPSSSGPTMSFQLKLYEHTGRVGFHYYRTAGPVTDLDRSASAGITGEFGSYQSLQDFSTFPSVRNDNAVADLNTQPETDQLYYFDPPTPNADPMSLFFTDIGSSSMRLNWSNPASNEIGYAVYVSTDNITFTFFDFAIAGSTDYLAEDLVASTTYYWKVYAVTEGALSNATSGSATTTGATLKTPVNASVSWSVDADWLGGTAPNAGDSVIIEGGMSALIDVPNAKCYHLTIGTGTGAAVTALDPNTNIDFTIGQDLVIASNGELNSGLTGTVTTHSISLPQGNLHQYGKLDLYTNSGSASASLTFRNRTAAQYFTCYAGSETDFQPEIGLRLSKGSDQQKLFFTTAGTITVGESNTAGFVDLLISNGGALEFTGTGSLQNPILNLNNFAVPANNALILNNPNIDLNGMGFNGYLELRGKLILQQGAIHLGSNTDEGLIAPSSNSQVEIHGGTFDVAGKFSLQTGVFKQTGGVLSVATVGNSSDEPSLNLGGTIQISGGTIQLVHPSSHGTPRDFSSNPSGSSFLTGGQLIIGTAATPNASSFFIKGSIRNLAFYSGSNINASLYGNTTISNTCDLTGANSTVTINGNTLTLQGSITGSGKLKGDAAATLVINGSGNAGTIAFESGFQQLSGLTLNRASSGQVSLGSNLSIGNMVFTAGKFALGSNTLTITNTLSGMSAARSFMANGSSSLDLDITATTVYFDQSVPGTSNQLEHLTYRRASQTITLGNATRVMGVITPVAGTLASGGNLTLVSNASGTASIASSACTSCNYITGTVMVQRYIPALARRWRFMGSNVTATTLADWKAETFITGTGGASNGFDATLSNQAGVFSYNETAGGDLNQGWLPASHINNSLVTGKGYRVFIRGDRSDNGRLTGTVTSQNAVTLDLQGVPHQGDVVMPVSYTANSVDSNDGWCFLSNPYPCPYDWNAHYDNGGFHSNISPTIWILNAQTGAYVFYNAASNVGGLTGGIIPSGAGFWVKATGANPSLTFKEQFKVTATAPALFKNQTASFSIAIELDSITADEAFVMYRADGKAGLDELDIRKLGGTVNISTYDKVDFVQLSGNVRPSQQLIDTLFLRVTGVAGSYQMRFKDAPIGSEFTELYLVDRYTSTVVDLSSMNSYAFTISSSAGSQGMNRFLIVGKRSETALPVQFASITAHETATGSVNITWATASEKSVASFVVERSHDGLTFHKIGAVKAKGESTILTRYMLLDERPLQQNYYRVQSVDQDGQVAYSPTVQIVTAFSVTNSLVYPNPASGGTITVAGADQNIALMQVYTASGVLIKEQRQKAVLDVSDLPSGWYVVRVEYRDRVVQSARFLRP